MKAKIILAIAMIMFAGVVTAQHEGVAWDSLREEQQRVLSDFADNWDTLAADRQERLSLGVLQNLPTGLIWFLRRWTKNPLIKLYQ